MLKKSVIEPGGTTRETQKRKINELQLFVKIILWSAEAAAKKEGAAFPLTSGNN